MPPSLIVALCTGPVTRPSQAPSRQARAAVSSAPTTARALRGSACPNSTGTALGIGCNGKSPGCVPTASAGSNRKGNDNARAAAASVSPSPKATSDASRRGCCARRTQSSGPMPAGSPGTSASRGGDISAAVGGRLRLRVGRCRRGAGHAHFDVGLATHFAQEAVVFVFELAAADRFAHLRLAALVRRALARADALDDVPARIAAEGLGHRAVGERCDLRAERGAELVRSEPAQVAAGGLGAFVFG